MTVKAHFTTYTGKGIDLFDMKEDDICIEDIAHQLALINRFNGSTRVPVSVAQHSVYVSIMCMRYPLQGLLHDASEAYLGDITKWLKGTTEFASYRSLEDKLQRMIFRKYGVDEDQHEEVSYADRFMCRLEGYKSIDRMTFDGRPAYGPPTLSDTSHFPKIVEARIWSWYPWTWEIAEHKFLQMFFGLTKPQTSFYEGIGVK